MRLTEMGAIQVVCYTGNTLQGEEMNNLDCWQVDSKAQAYRSIEKTEAKDQPKGAGHYNYAIYDLLNRFKTITLEGKY